MSKGTTPHRSSNESLSEYTLLKNNSTIPPQTTPAIVMTRRANGVMRGPSHSNAIAAAHPINNMSARVSERK